MFDLKQIWVNYKNREDVKDLVKNWKINLLIITICGLVVIGGGIYSISDVKTKLFIKSSLNEKFKMNEPFCNYDINIGKIKINQETEVAKVLFVIDNKKHFEFLDLTYVDGHFQGYQFRDDTFEFFKNYIIKKKIQKILNI